MSGNLPASTSTAVMCSELFLCGWCGVLCLVGLFLFGCFRDSVTLTFRCVVSGKCSLLWGSAQLMSALGEVEAKHARGVLHGVGFVQHCISCVTGVKVKDVSGC